MRGPVDEPSVEEIRQRVGQGGYNVGVPGQRDMNFLLRGGAAGQQSLEDIREGLKAQALAGSDAYFGMIPTLQEGQRVGLEEMRRGAGRAIQGSWGGAGGYGAVAGGAQTAALRQAALDAAGQTAAWNQQQGQAIQQARIAAEEAKLGAMAYGAGLGTPFEDRQVKIAGYGTQIRELDAAAEAKFGKGHKKEKAAWVVAQMEFDLRKETDPYVAAYVAGQLNEMYGGNLPTEIG